jgi:hypothetical protein
MAEKRTIELEIKDNTKTLKQQYKEAVVELQNMAAAYGETSTEAAQAAKRAAELKDQIEDTNDLLQSYKGEGTFIAMGKAMSAVASGFSAIEGGLGLVGVESENVQKTMLKVQSAMALAQGLEGLEDAGRSMKNLYSRIKETSLAQKVLTGVQTAYNFVVGAGSGALKAFRAALISTGIGAIIVAVGLLIANFDLLLDALQPVIESLKAVGDFLGFTDFAGEEAHENEMARLEAEKQAREELAAAREEQFNSSQKQYEREIALMDAQGKDTKKLTKLKIEESIKYQKEKLKEIELEIRASEQTVNTLKKLVGTDSESIKRYEDIKKQRIELTEGIKDAQNQLLINEVNNNKKSAEAAQAAAEKAREAAKKKREDYVTNLQKQNEDAAKLEEEAENQRLALMQDGIEKEKALREDQFNDYRDNFLKERTKEEQTALDNQYKEGKISRETYNKLTEELQINAYNKLTQQEKDILKNAKELLNKDLLAIDEKYQAEVKKRAEDFQKKMQDDEKQRKLAFDMEIERMEEENYQASLTAQDKELYLISEKYAEMERMAKGNADAEKTIAEMRGREVAAINQKYDKENEERKRAELERNVGFAKQGLTIIQDLTDLFGKKGIESARKAFKVKKAAQMASALIDTYMNATAAYGSQFLPLPDPSSPVRGGIAAGLAVAAGLVNVAKIGAQKFEGGGSSGGGGGGGGVSGGSLSAGGGMQAPNFNVVGNNGLNQLAQLQQQPTQAFVVSGEVTSAQSLDRNRIQNATL